MRRRIALLRCVGRSRIPAASMDFPFSRWSAAPTTIHFSFRTSLRLVCSLFPAGTDTAIDLMNTPCRRILRGVRWCWRSRLQGCPPDALWMKESRRQAAALQRRDPSSDSWVTITGSLPLFLLSVDFKGTLSCFRINTSGVRDSQGVYGGYYRLVW